MNPTAPTSRSNVPKSGRGPIVPMMRNRDGERKKEVTAGMNMEGHQPQTTNYSHTNYPTTTSSQESVFSRQGNLIAVTSSDRDSFASQQRSSAEMYYGSSGRGMDSIAQLPSQLPDAVFQLASQAVQSLTAANQGAAQGSSANHMQEKRMAPATQNTSQTPKGKATAMDMRKLHFQVVRFMFHASAKLHMSSVPLATACMVYHRVFRTCSPQNYDPYLIASTSLYLAGKIEEDHLKLRDVINVCYNTLHPDRQPLDIGSTYWSLRETMVNCELFIMRLLRFRVAFIHPHKYLLHYIKSVQDLLQQNVVANVPIAKTAWALLRDSYHGNLCLRYEPEHIAVAALYLALQVHGIDVPLNMDGEYRWWEALVEDIKLEDIRKIMQEMIEVYNMEIPAMTAS